ncbi:YbaN family protein [Herbaspirillum sp. DW155]|uniref:YbaN family protein n=1 Tax=Herbaspirillum sp. DW155 TaxID=3095609 RepID=UPI00308F631B|nr:YbaN family protein [Herbaspirillum sp. DW155]
MTRPAAGQGDAGVRRLVQWGWLLLAYASLAVGVIAIFIPGLPTTEFILLSAWAASRGSPRLQHWLEGHRLFGPMIYNWRHGRAVTIRAKLSASLTMMLCLLIMGLTIHHHRWIILLAALGMALGAAWMWSRPAPAGSGKAENALPEKNPPGA